MSKQSRQIFLRDNCICQYCGFDGRGFMGWKQLTIDHVDPQGGNGLNNLVTCCHHCNSVKGKRTTKLNQKIQGARQYIEGQNKEHYKWYLEKYAPYIKWPPIIN
jgi:5-methylcytosine-specific restriction endonuclease McrA